MGVERAVTRWYAQRQLLLDEIAFLEARVAPLLTAEDVTLQRENADLVEQLARTQEKLHLLGPCPKPMMG